MLVVLVANLLLEGRELMLLLRSLATLPCITSEEKCVVRASLWKRTIGAKHRTESNDKTAVEQYNENQAQLDTIRHLVAGRTGP